MAELNIVLVEPEIPQNTGNIAKTAYRKAYGIYAYGQAFEKGGT